MIREGNNLIFSLSLQSHHILVCFTFILFLSSYYFYWAESAAERGWDPEEEGGGGEEGEEGRDRPHAWVCLPGYMSGRLIIGHKRDYLMKIDIKLPQLNKAYLFHGLGDRDIAPRADGVHVWRSHNAGLFYLLLRNPQFYKSNFTRQTDCHPSVTLLFHRMTWSTSSKTTWLESLCSITK